MSDLTPMGEPVDVASLDPAAAEPAPLDAATIALIDQLMPVLQQVAKSAVAEAVDSTPTPTLRPGTVTGVNPADRTVSVQVDGDTVAIAAQSLIDLPSVADRVMVAFWPPSAVFVIGNQSANSVPAGTLAPYAGPVSAHAGAASTSATPGQPPRGWLWCAGQAVSRSTYASLFAAIGTTYGAGDGATTFNVPDFRGRVFLGLDNMGGSDAGRLSVTNTLGGTGGAETVTLAEANLPSHTHGLNSHTHSFTPTGTISGSVGSHAHSISSAGSHSHVVNAHSHGSPSGNFFATFGGGGSLTDGAGPSNISGSSANTTNASPGTDSQGSHDHGAATGSATPSFSGSFTGSGGTTGAAAGSTAAVGSGTAFNKMPPYLLVHVLIKT